MHIVTISDDGPLIPDARRRWLVIFAVWTGIALFFVGQDLVRFAVRNQPIFWWVLRSEVMYWWAFIPLTPPALAAARRFWITRENRWGTITILCIVALVFALAHEAILTTILYVTRGTGLFVPAEDVIDFADLRRIPVSVLTGFYKFWAMIGIYYAFVYARRSRHQQIHSAQLEARLAQADLQALRMQLHPHFLFNTLHAVSMLNFSDVDAANRMLVQLSDLLRMSLDNSGKQHVTLREEIDFLRKYLEIEQTRFQDRLRVEFDIQPDLYDAKVPHLILQPLVENAIRHGVAKLSHSGRVVVSARRTDSDQLEMSVCDNGPGIADLWDIEKQARIGLGTTLERLKQLYGTGQQVYAARREMTCFTIIIPLEL